MSYHPKGRSWPNKTGIATKQDSIMTPVKTSIQIINHFLELEGDTHHEHVS